MRSIRKSCVCVHACVRVHAHMFTCVYVYACVHVCEHMCACACACVCVHTLSDGVQPSLGSGERPSPERGRRTQSPRGAREMLSLAGVHCGPHGSLSNEDPQLSCRPPENFPGRRAVETQSVAPNSFQEEDSVGEGGKSTADVVQLFSRVRPFATPWTAARQASLSITSSWSFTQTHVH